MTCIIGIAQDGKVFIGGDSASVAGREIRKTTLPKVFRVNSFLIGYTTSFRMGQLLQYKLDVPQQKKMNDMKYMVTVFAEAVRECLKDGGFTKIESNQEETGTFLVGYKGHLYCMYGDLQVNECRNDFDAVGCGREYALGAMQALDLPPKKRILSALRISAYFSNSVIAPFRVRVLKS